MRKLLVTGGAGFIGSNFVHYWLAKYPDDRVVVLDALTYAGNLQNLSAAQEQPAFRFVHGSICNTELVDALLRAEHIDTIVHFAAESHVDRSITGPDAFIEANIVGTHSLLKAARSYWLEEQRLQHRFHHVSTDEVYGSLGADDAPFTETTAYAPNSPYSASKAASDYLVRAYHHTYALEVTTSNCSNNYGPFQFPEKLIPLIITNILQGKPLPVYGDGKNIRDWLHVSDHCLAIDLILADGKIGEVYNVGGRNETLNIELVGELCDLVDAACAADPSVRVRFPDAPLNRRRPARSLIEFVRDRPGHDRRYAIDNGKIENALAYRPQVSLREGLQQTVRWYLENAGWWQDLLARTAGRRADG